MADIGQQRRIRGALRRSITRLITKLQTLKDDTPNADVAKFKGLKLQFEECKEKLTDSDNKIIDIISRDEDSEEACTLEMEEVDEWTEKVNFSLSKIDEILDDLVSVHSTRASSVDDEDERSSIAESSKSVKSRVRAKLPQLEMKRFDGKPSDWQEFWDCYKSAIHDNEDLNEVDKFHYLRRLLDEPARAVVSGFELSSRNYEAAIELLKNRFAKPTAIKRAHINQLINVSPARDIKNVAKLRSLYDKIETHHRGLETLGVDEATYSAIVVPVLLEKLPDEFRTNMIRGSTVEDHTDWTIDNMLEAFQKELRIRESYEPIFKDSKVKDQGGQEKNWKPSASSLYAGNAAQKCVYCWDTHASQNCTKVKDVTERKELLRKFRRCFICTFKGHRAADCKSTYKCSNCKGRHHRSICKPRAQQEQPSPSNLASVQGQGNEENPSSVTPPLSGDKVSINSCVGNTSGSARVVLQTAQAVVNAEKERRVRVLFDTGSHRSFVTSKVVESLGLEPVSREVLSIQAFGGKQLDTQERDVVKLNLKSVDFKNNVEFLAYVIDDIAEVANEHPERVKWDYTHLRDVWFSDVSKDQDILQIDILIGADHLWRFQENETKRGRSDEPVAVRTKLGWVLSGPLKGKIDESLLKSCSSNALFIASTSEKKQLDNQVHQLWDLDSIGIREGDGVYEEFSDNVYHTGERYGIKLPWKEGHGVLPSNFSCSKARLKSQLRKLREEPEILQEYDKIIKEQENLKIIEKVTELESAEKVHYLPHHAVIRRDAETTKVRVVYDASCKEGKKGTSLNDCLHIGPSLTPLLFDILIKFRSHKIALIGDIEKAFLNVEVDPCDRDCLRFLWVDDINSQEMSFVTYRFNRVVFGVNSSPFLLNAVLRHHINEYSFVDPSFVKKVSGEFYVDDWISGGGTLEEVYDLYQKVNDRMKEGGFHMRKWKTSDPELEKLIYQNDKISQVSEVKSISLCQEEQNLSDQTADSKTKVLGMPWDFKSDEFDINLSNVLEQEQEFPVTKRSMLSAIARLFDPLGLVSPVSVRAKALFQEVCLEKIGWDDKLPTEMENKWRSIISSIKDCPKIIVPRCLQSGIQGEILNCTLHGFGDASQTAYCASIYVVFKTTTGTYSKLLCSKTRVAPLRKLTIPRLELMSARILVTLMDTVYNALSSQMEIHGVRYWLDSKTALFWINNRGEWKQFVAHRVNEILKLSQKGNWGHCPGVENPADLGSRGVSPGKLQNCRLWWQGPTWLQMSEDEWPRNLQLDNSDQVNEERKKNVTVVSTLVVNTKPVIDIDRFSSFHRLVNVTAWVFRFIHNIKAKAAGRKLSLETLGSEEISAAEKYWIKQAQSTFQKDDKFTTRSKNLNTFVEDGIIRCRGRLEHSELEPSAKFPILLPRNDKLTELIVFSCHFRVQHCGVKATLAELRDNYWVIKGRQYVRKVISKCITCKRIEGKAYAAPHTASLPEFRVNRAFPFSKIGLDYAGPLYVKSDADSIIKAYILLFTCCVTRAIHLELVKDLSAPAFLAAFRRFCARRGTPSLIVSDNAKTFKAAVKILRDISENSSVQSTLERRHIDWKFNLERSPWWGGFFERMVGGVKRCLRKVLGKACLSFDEMCTVLTEVECTLNCRPLTFVYEEVGQEPLTPSHLIYGQRLLSLPDGRNYDSEDSDQKQLVSKRYKYIILSLNHFWNRWRKEYLVDLRESHKMEKERDSDIKVGDIVMVFDENAKRNTWKMGKILELIHGKDDTVRGARLRQITSGKPIVISRPLQKLFPLETGESSTAAVQHKKTTKDGDREERERENESRVRRNVPTRAAARDARWKTRILLDS